MPSSARARVDFVQIKRQSTYRRGGLPRPPEQSWISHKINNNPPTVGGDDSAPRVRSDFTQSQRQRKTPKGRASRARTRTTLKTIGEPYAKHRLLRQSLYILFFHSVQRVQKRRCLLFLRGFGKKQKMPERRLLYRKGAGRLLGLCKRIALPHRILLFRRKRCEGICFVHSKIWVSNIHENGRKADFQRIRLPKAI